MNPEHTQRLFDRFDHLYRGRHLPQTQNLMCYGFSCGDCLSNLKRIARHIQNLPI